MSQPTWEVRKVDESSQQSNPAFAKAFLPGLILGLVVGALAGAFIPTIVFERPAPVSASQPVPSSTASREREMREMTTPAEPKAAEAPVQEPPSQEPPAGDPTNPGNPANPAAPADQPG
jgi:hypothetical protein